MNNDILLDSARVWAQGSAQVSVVIPTYGRPQLLERCLAALLHQTLSGARFEVLVVDDGASAETLSALARWTERTQAAGPRITYIAVEGGPRGPAAARNRGWRLACAPIIAFTDDDTEPDARWLEEGLRAFRTGVDVVCGRIVMPVPELPTDYERDASALERSEFVTANCLCRRSALERLQGFDERFRLAWREDSDLHFRLLESGACIVRMPAAVVVHPVRRAKWGVSLAQQKKVVFDALLFKKHQRLYRERIRSAPRWDYYVIVACLCGGIALALAQRPADARLALITWGVLTAAFALHRLRGASKNPRHVAEMLLTSALIPPLAVFWRMVGAVRYRVLFV